MTGASAMFGSALWQRHELSPGTSLDRYEILARIGTGRFGSVYRAWDPAIEREVALKTCESGDERIRERFAREARLAGGLDHPNIVRIYDLQDRDDLAFMVQEFVDGEDLARKLARSEPVPLPEKLRILDEVACGLAHAHAKGVVHRDIKPGNIRILPDGRLKILDFGIAKAIDPNRTTTRPGVTIGSVGYMAPEQIEGGDVDQRTDLFALGIVGYELLAGRKPFGGECLPELLDRILYDEPAPLSEIAPGVPAELEALILRALSKDPAGRPACAEEFRRDLEETRRATGCGA